MKTKRGYWIAIFFVLCNFCIFGAEVKDVEAKTPSTGSMLCEYILEYNGYDQKTQKVIMTVEVKNGSFQKPKFEEWQVSSTPFLPSTKNDNYKNTLKAENFTNSDGTEWICNQVSYAIDKTEKKDGWKIQIGGKTENYRNLVGPNKSIYGEDIDAPEEEDPEETPGATATPSPSPSDTPTEEEKKIEWGTMGEKIENTNCQSILGDLVDELQKYYDWIKIIAPILLIVFGAIDFAGAVLNQGKDQLSKALLKFIKRAIAAIAIFFLPLIINLLLTLPGIPSMTDVICGIY